MCAALVAEVADLGGAELHPGGQLVAGDAGARVRVSPGCCARCRSLRQLQEIARGRVRLPREIAAGVARLRDRLVGVEGRALKHGRQESRAPVVRPDLRHAARIGNGDERRQVLVLGAQGVAHPRAHAGKAIEGEAGAHLIFGRAVRVGLGRHRVDEAHVVRQVGQVRQQVGDHLAALAARPEFPQRLSEVAVLALEGDQLLAARASAGRGA